MIELINVSFNGANFISGFLLILILLYWITVMLGALDVNFLDVEVEVDTDADVEGVSASGDVSWLNYILRFLNIGRVPFMIWLSFFTLVFWLVQVTVNQFFGFETFILGLLTLIPIIIVCAFVAKFFSFPFVKIFDAMEKESMSTDLTGSVGAILLIDAAGKVGQAKVKNNDNYHTIYFYTQEGTAMRKGDQILVIAYNRAKNAYLVEPYN